MYDFPPQVYLLTGSVFSVREDWFSSTLSRWGHLDLSCYEMNLCLHRNNACSYFNFKLNRKQFALKTQVLRYGDSESSVSKAKCLSEMCCDKKVCP